LVKALFHGYRSALHSQRNKQILLKIHHIDDKDAAAKYIGRKIVWRSLKNKKLTGKITGVHGRNGVLKASFKKGLPAQAIGTELEII
jgi:large subunit ribosomal protein L35Ae